ncbi:hypothetical protein M231_03128 [Tremella mesenterica]|uniref:Retrotransposon gag domain-containing protein n=1 Tax=Tremella mesenterica TaxID=5217 RepID=A0A4Q1BP16_TREME|nr:hypothetical protein M231_03128 [Tremella mesenterica]
MGSKGSGQTPRPRERNTEGRLSLAGSEAVRGTEEEATTQKMMLAMMNMMMEMNRDMIAERKRWEEQEKKKEQETVGGIVEGISEGVRFAMGRQASGTPGVAEMGGGIKLPLPDLWRGKRSKLTTACISECEIHFEINAHKFPTDQVKIFFMISFLCETPLLALQPDLPKNDPPEHLLDYKKFIQYLETNFGDPDEERTAARGINKLQQNGSASEYFAAFQ